MVWKCFGDWDGRITNKEKIKEKKTRTHAESYFSKGGKSRKGETKISLSSDSTSEYEKHEGSWLLPWLRGVVSNEVISIEVNEDFQREGIFDLERDIGPNSWTYIF